MSLTEFWDSTPREIVAVIRAAGERSFDHLDAAITAAWRGAYCGRIDKFPDLRDVIPRRPGQCAPGRDITEEVMASRRRARVEAQKQGA